jgi:hypothetical protein
MLSPLPYPTTALSLESVLRDLLALLTPDDSPEGAISAVEICPDSMKYRICSLLNPKSYNYCKALANPASANS